MKENAWITLLCALLCSETAAQKYDYQWPFGDGDNFATGFGISILDFNNQLVTTAPFAEVPVFEMSHAGSFICDETGQLILMTNNCEIVDRNFQTIPGGGMLNPGPTHDVYCADYGDYPAAQSSVFVPDPTTDSVFYLLHKDSETWDAKQDLVSRNFYLSIIIRKPDHSFYVKENRLLLHGDMVINRLTACRNQDETRWWTWVAGYDSNRFYKFLIGGPEFVQGPFIQDFGIKLKNKELDVGQTAFSADGKKMGINTKVHGLLLYDFDAVTGAFSNLQTFPYPNMEHAEGLAFAPNSSLVYLSAGRDLYQMNLDDPDPSGTVFHLGLISLTDENGWPIGVGYLYPGPDCRIYVSPGTTTRYLHVIHQPNRLGADCQLEIKAIRAPTRLEFDLPNIPVYHREGQCDDSIAWGITATGPSPGKAGAGVLIYPNPAQDQIRITVPQHNTASIFEIRTVDGRQVIRCEVDQADSTVDLTRLPAGMYYWQLTAPQGHYQNGRLVVIRP